MSKGLILITGATGGIGSALCQQMSAEGYQLVIAARQQDRLRELAESLRVESISADLTQPEAVQDLITHTLEKFGRIDGIAHCVGSLLLKPAHLTTPDEWLNTLNANLTSAFWIVRSGVKAMQKTGGSIVLLASAAARTGIANHEAIAASKAGVIGLMLSAAATYAPQNIRINCVAPGLIETPLTARLLSTEKAREASEALHPLHRVGKPEEVASAIAWLLNAQQSWITGQVIGVDGGLATLKSR